MIVQVKDADGFLLKQDGYQSHVQQLQEMPTEARTLTGEAMPKTWFERQFFDNMGMVEIDRYEAVEIVRKMKQQGECGKDGIRREAKILDLSGGTSAHMRFASVVTDFDNSARPYQWFKSKYPEKQYLGGMDLGKVLKFEDEQFDYMWAANVFVCLSRFSSFSAALGGTSRCTTM